jgi:hypothetical protein
MQPTLPDVEPHDDHFPEGVAGDVARAYREHLQGLRRSIWQLTGGILGQRPSSSPCGTSVKACFVDGCEAVLEVTGTLGGAAVCGRIVLCHYAGAWHVLSENYMGCTPQGYCLNPVVDTP